METTYIFWLQETIFAGCFSVVGRQKLSKTFTSCELLVDDNGEKISAHEKHQNHRNDGTKRKV